MNLKFASRGYYVLGLMAVIVVVIANKERLNEQIVLGSMPRLPLSNSTRDSHDDKLPKLTTLERVRQVAQTKWPQLNFNHQEQTVFAAINPQIDELAVMELLLAVETEFAVDIPTSAINERIGLRNRRDLRNGLSLSLIADLVHEVEPTLVH